MKKDDIQKLALLAQISISDSEAESYAKDFESILGYVSQLNEYTSDGFDPRRQVKTSGMHDDVVSQVSGRNEILNNFPEREGDEVVVPKVLSYGDGE
jgi:aspartyl/glutamyl-tRNA(Asn/Gln) amidotransferase C subunit